MNEDWITVLLVWLLALIVTIIIVFGVTDVRDLAYKNGQIDAMTGKIQYHLIVNSDSTKEWEKIVK